METFRIQYVGSGTTDELEPASLASTGNEEVVTTNKPVVIYQYEYTVIWGGPAGAAFQFYGDDDDIDSLKSWNLSDATFQQGLRNKMFMGSQPSFESDDSPPYGHAPNFKVYKLKFKARKNPRKMRAKFGKWAIKPIVIGPHTANIFGVSVVNLKTGDNDTSFDNQRFYAHLELKRWQTEY